MSNALIRTTYGFFAQDKSGLWHYQHLWRAGVDEVHEDVLKFRPNAAAWFWWNGTPAPIHADDTTGTLAERWGAWRRVYHRDPGDMLKQLRELAKEACVAADAVVAAEIDHV